ncbi:Smr/MutS family protein [Aquilutibacter rugosus]|uniref:Smr/MutS family protein n=1 Tax=Aquilutibacter rugosus TaxID=3115820 RepID=UPI002F3ECE8C
MNDDDEHLFRDAIGDGIRPVRHTPRAETGGAKPRPSVRMGDQDEADALRAFRLGLHDDAIGASDLLSYRHPDLPSTAWQKLKRGELSVRDELDLHDLTLEPAQRVLGEFLRHARRERHGCVLVIHGKGLGSDGFPAIKNMVNQSLRHRSEVLGFHSAPRSMGGAGAVLIVLRTQR